MLDAGATLGLRATLLCGGSLRCGERRLDAECLRHMLLWHLRLRRLSGIERMDGLLEDKGSSIKQTILLPRLLKSLAFGLSWLRA